MPSSVSILPVDGIVGGDHVCAVLDGPAAQAEIVTEFVSAGLARRERVAYFAGDSSRERVLGMLHGGGIATGEPLAQGQLSIVPLHEHAGEENVDPARRIAAMSAAIDGALADGYSGFRATGEQWAARKLPREDLLLEYERLVGDLCATRPAVALCQYESARCDPQLIENARELHRHVVRNVLVSANGLLRLIPLTRDENGDSWLRVTGEADISNSDLILAALDESGNGDLHLDLARLEFVDLHGVEALKELGDALRSSRRRLILHNSPPTLLRIIEILGGRLRGGEIFAP